MALIKVELICEGGDCGETCQAIMSIYEGGEAAHMSIHIPKTWRVKKAFFFGKKTYFCPKHPEK